MTDQRKWNLHIKRYVISGIATIIPLWVTWILLDFTFHHLSRFGKPLVRTLSFNIKNEFPEVSRILLSPWFQDIIGFIIVLCGLYTLGWAVNRVLGKKLLGVFENIMDRLPFVQTIYGSAKKLITAIQTKPNGIQRVVLVDFPHEHMKTVGLVTQILVDTCTGQKLAAVYVPTTPNPTSGYLEIVPVDRLVATDWTIDEAIRFVISGGTVAPDRFVFGKEIP